MKLNYEKDKIFFTADPHFSHEAIIKFCNRPFKNKDEMNETMVRNWNSVVPEDGIVFLIGDVGFGDSKELRKILDSLNGKIYLIIGNHDKPALHKNCLTRFESFKNNNFERDLMLSVDDPDAENGVQSLHLYHYAVVDWNKKFHNGWHLHGHSHQTLHQTDLGKLLYEMKIIDVGVDGHNFTPLSYNQVKEIMKTKKTHF